MKLTCHLVSEIGRFALDFAMHPAALNARKRSQMIILAKDAVCPSPLKEGKMFYADTQVAGNFADWTSIG